MPDLTPLEAAEKLEKEAGFVERFYRYYGADGLDDGYISALRFAASYLRKIAAGEYKQVVHGYWKKVDDGVLIGDGTHLECSNCHVWSSHRYAYCRCCGAVMDRKDDSHE